jgi:predicted regulator of Ras-like GTPase activity (Roadblock/LC7/MglB family)
MSAADVALERITRVPGVRGSVLISGVDGLVVAERLMEGIDGKAIAALAGNLLQKLMRATAGAGLEAPTFVHLRSSAGSLLATPGGDDLVLVTLVGLDANLGLARLEMLDAIGHLA